MTKHEPCPEEDMHQKVKVNTICSVIRQIYRRSEDPEVKMMCRVAATMAKKMANKLETYKRNWDTGFWDG